MLLFLLTIYLLYKIIDIKEIKIKNYLEFIILSILIAIANNIRPIMLIFIIALIIYYILTKRKVKEYLCLIITITIFIIANNCINGIIENKFDTTLRSGALEWSIYFETNYEICGGWSEEDSNKAFKILENAGVNELLKESFNRFWNLKTNQKLLLGMCKYYRLWSDSNSSYTYFDLVTKNDYARYTEYFDQISKLIVILILLMIINNIIYELKSKKNNHMFLKIFIIGYILANLLIVVNGRYNYIIYPLLLIIITKEGNENHMKEKISKLVNVYKKYGFIGFCKKLRAYIIANYLDKISLEVIFKKGKYKNIIKEILSKNDYDRIILWRSSFGYDVPLFQRPQHIANNLAKNKCLVFYEVTTMTDKVKTLKKHSNNIYLFIYLTLIIKL